jgi:hypothetical protein
MHVCMYTLQGGVPSSINVGEELSLRFHAQDLFGNGVLTGGAGTTITTAATATAMHYLDVALLQHTQHSSSTTCSEQSYASHKS